MEEKKFIRLTAGCGMAAAVVFLVFLAISIFGYSGYSPTSHYLSDLGVGQSSLFFNAGVIVSGILGVIFATGLYKFLYGYAKYGSLTFLFASASLVGVGVFTEQSPMHDVFSGAFFILAAISLIVIGVGLKTKLGYFSVIVGILSLVYIPAGLMPIIEHIAVIGIVVWAFLLGRHVSKSI